MTEAINLHNVESLYIRVGIIFSKWWHTLAKECVVNINTL